MSAVLAPNPHRALSTTDIILLISEILRDEKEYATLACFALSSHMHHSAVQPLLAKIKKRIVLDIEDWRWRDRSNDKNIEILIIRHNSPQLTPRFSTLESPAARQFRDLDDTALRPTTLLFRGAPSPDTLSVWAELFEWVVTIRVSEDIWARTDNAGADRDSDTIFDWSGIIQRGNRLVESFAAGGLDYLNLQHDIHDSHQHFSIDDPRQDHYTIRGVRHSDEILMRRISTRSETILGQRNDAYICAHEACTLPNFSDYDDIEIDCYRQLPSGDSTYSYFYDPETYWNERASPLPAEFQALSDLVEELATKHLSDARSTITFRLFVLNHRGVWQDREDMTPIYHTVCGISASGTKKGNATVLERFIDYDFVKCCVNGGCKKCASQGRFEVTEE